MKKSIVCSWLAAIAIIFVLTTPLLSQDIIQFENGYVTFSNDNPALFYRVEFRPNLTGLEEWSVDYEKMRNIQSSDPEVTIPVGVFYRVVGREQPDPVAPLIKTGQAASYRLGDDGWWSTNEVGVAWPDTRFTDHNDGTVTDNLTGLMWVKAPHDLPNNSGTTNWNVAIDFCNSLTYAGHSDWRLPNVRELQSLADFDNRDPALPSGHPFIDISPNRYWSSSTYSEFSDRAWYMVLVGGQLAVELKTDSYRVWPVRRIQ